MNRKHPKPNNQRKILRTRQLCAAAFALAAGFSFQTAWANCTVSVPAVNEMKVDFLNNEGLERPIQMTLQCTNSGNSSVQEFDVCIALDGGRKSKNIIAPDRHMYYQNSTNNPHLLYNIYEDSAHSKIVSSTTYGGIPLRKKVILPSGSTTQELTFPVYVKINSGQSVTAGEYIADFASTSAILNWISSSECSTRTPKDWQGAKINDFTIKATVVNSCKIEVPANIDFGEKSITDTNLTGNTNINVTCSKDHPYHIGLTTKNINNKEGRGSMRQASGSDTIEYVLRKERGSRGERWGDSGNIDKAQGSRQFSGTGTQQSHPVYATIANIPSNVSAGEYQDTVTVNVYY